MRILFIHQNMPAQYAHLAAHYAKDPANEVFFLTRRKNMSMPGVKKVLYDLAREPSRNAHNYVRMLDEQLLYGQAAARQALKLKDNGFTPDIICAHSGWGEALFLRDVFPDVPILIYGEFFYRGRGADVGFGAEENDDLDKICRARMRNTHMLLSLEASDWAVTPTEWQWRQHPAQFRPRISVIHDGIRTGPCAPDPSARLVLPNGRIIDRNTEVITFVSRNLEPYRGFDQFMRCLPEIQKRRPNALVLIIGGDEVSYGSLPADARNWRQKMLSEVTIDPSRVMFLGKVPYDYFLSYLKISSLHVYLTYPFVLSWSMLEAMSCGCAIVASETQPVREVMTHGKTGEMVDFFDNGALTDRICALLEDPERRRAYGEAARAHVVANYDLDTVCLPRQLALIEKVANRDLPRFWSSAVEDGFPGAPPEIV